MGLAEFEEKELEGPLNAQLSMGGPLWSPGQVLEKIVGFDAALMVDELAFWSAVGGLAATPTGLPVLASWWPGWPSIFLRPIFRFRSPPPFRLNVFLQYKRPEHLTRGQEWVHWRVPYYRFILTAHQQRALEACARSLGSAGLVAYGSPAFHRRSDLFLHIEKRTLVANTHFAPVTPLATHSRYTYVAARAKGKAHSKATDVEPIVFPEHLESELDAADAGAPPPPPRGDDGGAGEGPTPDSLLADAKKAARAAIAASPSIVGGADGFERILTRARRITDALRIDTDEERRRTAINAFLVAALFSRLSGVLWMVKA